MAAGPHAPSTTPPPAAAPDRPIVALARQTLVYGLSGVVLQLVGIVTLPIFARVFSPSEFGVLEVGLVSSWVVAAVADLGLASASQRSFFDHGDDEPAARRSVLLTALVATLACATGMAIVLFLARATVSDWLFGDDRYGDVIALIAAAVPVTIAANFLREVLRLHFRPWHYVGSAGLGAIVSGAAGVLAVVAFDSGVEGVFLGVLLGSSVAVFYGVFPAGRELLGRFDVVELRTMLAFGLPLVPTAFALWALSFQDRLLLAKLGDLDDVGQYAVAARVSGVLGLAIVGFQLALSPYIFSIYSRDPEVEKVVRSQILTYLTAALAFAGLGLTLFSPELIAIIAPDYDDAYTAVAPLMLGAVAFGMSALLAAGISLARRTLAFAYGSGLAMLINVAANLVLIPAAGIVGAGIASALGFWFLASFYYVVGQRVYPTPYEPWKPAVAIGLAAVLALAVAAPLSLLPGLALKAAALVAFFPALRLTGVLTKEDVGHARDLSQGALARLRGRPTDVAAAP